LFAAIDIMYLLEFFWHGDIKYLFLRIDWKRLVRSGWRSENTECFPVSLPALKSRASGQHLTARWK
jgi:hypothetical protein